MLLPQSPLTTAHRKHMTLLLCLGLSCFAWAGKKPPAALPTKTTTITIDWKNVGGKVVKQVGYDPSSSFICVKLAAGVKPTRCWVGAQEDFDAFMSATSKDTHYNQNYRKKKPLVKY